MLLYRKKEAENVPEKRKRLEILLPETHPIWQVPRGKRAAFAAACLDMGARLAAIEGRLASLEEALARLEARLEGAVRAGPVNAGPQEVAALPDPDGFLAAFE